MQTIARLLAVCGLTLCCGVASAQTIAYDTVDSSVVGYATFNANTQKLARNRNGTLIAYTKAQNPAYTAQNIRFVLVGADDVAHEVFSGTWATNAPCVEASDSGEFFTAFPDWALNQLRVYVWRDISASAVPEELVYPLHGDGKYSCAFDETRRTLYYIGYSGILAKVRVDSGTIETKQIWTNGPNPAQYPSLQISRDGVLHLFWLTITGSNVHYRSVQYMASPNDGQNWFQTWHPRYASPELTLPVGSDEGGSSLTLSRSEDIAANTPLEATLADDDSFQAVWLFTPGFAERCFPVEKRCSAVYIKHSRLTGQRTAQHVPIRRAGGAVLRPKGGGGLVRRGADVFFITTDQNDIVLLRAGDFGMVQVMRTPVPNGGPDRCPYSLGVARGQESDTDIIGVFTLLDVSCGHWATYTGPTPLMGSVIRFRVVL